MQSLDERRKEAVRFCNIYTDELMKSGSLYEWVYREIINLLRKQPKQEG